LGRADVDDDPLNLGPWPVLDLEPIDPGAIEKHLYVVNRGGTSGPLRWQLGAVEVCLDQFRLVTLAGGRRKIRFRAHRSEPSRWSGSFTLPFKVSGPDFVGVDYLTVLASQIGSPRWRFRTGNLEDHLVERARHPARHRPLWLGLCECQAWLDALAGTLHTSFPRETGGIHLRARASEHQELVIGAGVVVPCQVADWCPMRP
jgi:hypothetical protein